MVFSSNGKESVLDPRFEINPATHADATFSASKTVDLGMDVMTTLSERVGSSSRKSDTYHSEQIDSTGKIEAKRIGLFIMVVIVVDAVILECFDSNYEASSPIWQDVLSSVFWLLYSIEIVFRFYTKTPTCSFFRDIFYVVDLFIVLICCAMHVAESLNDFTAVARALRSIQAVRTLKIVRLSIRILEILQDRHNCKPVISCSDGSMHIDLKLKIDNSQLESLRARSKSFESLEISEMGAVRMSGNRREVNILELQEIIEALKEQEEVRLFQYGPFGLKWIMIAIVWIVLVVIIW